MTVVPGMMAKRDPWPPPLLYTSELTAWWLGTAFFGIPPGEMIPFEHWDSTGWLKHEETNCWVVVSKIFYFHPYLGKIPILTNIFQRGWNHQLDWVLLKPGRHSSGLQPVIRLMESFFFVSDGGSATNVQDVEKSKWCLELAGFSVVKWVGNQTWIWQATKLLFGESGKNWINPLQLQKGDLGTVKYGANGIK